jgi:Flp pilus assembly protein TadG
MRPSTFTARVQRRFGALARDRRGATIIEFGLIAPPLIVMLMGALDIGHTLYMQGVLQGAVQKAARDGTLETASGNTDGVRNGIDSVVRNQLLTLNNTATVTFRRRFYRTFSEASAQAAEQFTDTDHDGICNHNEPFDDRNNNGVRDTDGGDSIDRAGARDNVIYTVTISYPRMFPIDKLIGGRGTVSLSASTVLASQPYGDQGAYGTAGVGHCA